MDAKLEQEARDTEKMRAASYLLPEPGGEVVRECLDKIDALERCLAEAMEEIDLLKLQAVQQSRALQAQPAEGGVGEGFVMVPGVYVNKEGRPVMSTEGDNMTPAILSRRGLRPLYDVVGNFWPEGLVDRIKSAEQRIQDNHAPRRIPTDPTDVDLVLAEVRLFIEGKPAPFWIAAPKPATTTGEGV